MEPSFRASPNTAENFSMTIIGDTIVNIQLNGKSIDVNVQNVQFLLFENLSIPAILGIEVLRKVQFQVLPEKLYLDNTAIPTLHGNDYYLNMRVVNAVTRHTAFDEAAITVATVKMEDDVERTFQTFSEGNYLVTVIRPVIEIIMFQPSCGKNIFDVNLVSEAEL